MIEKIIATCVMAGLCSSELLAAPPSGNHQTVDASDPTFTKSPSPEPRTARSTLHIQLVRLPTEAAIHFQRRLKEGPDKSAEALKKLPELAARGMATILSHVTFEFPDDGTYREKQVGTDLVTVWKAEDIPEENQNWDVPAQGQYSVDVVTQDDGKVGLNLAFEQAEASEDSGAVFRHLVTSASLPSGLTKIIQSWTDETSTVFLLGRSEIPPEDIAPSSRPRLPAEVADVGVEFYRLSDAATAQTLATLATSDIDAALASLHEKGRLVAAQTLSMSPAHQRVISLAGRPVLGVVNDLYERAYFGTTCDITPNFDPSTRKVTFGYQIAFGEKAPNRTGTHLLRHTAESPPIIAPSETQVVACTQNIFESSDSEPSPIVAVFKASTSEVIVPVPQE